MRTGRQLQKIRAIKSLNKTGSLQVKEVQLPTVNVLLSQILYILRFDMHISVFSGDSKRLETTRLYGWGPCLNPSTCSFNVPWH